MHVLSSSPNGGWRSSSLFSMHWDGTTWQEVATPDLDGSSEDLLDVVAVSPNDVWAVGGANYGQSPREAILHWHGSGWIVVEGLNNGYLAGPDKLGPDDIWGVGTQVNSTLAEHYNLACQP